MNNKIFRKSSIDRISSPDQLNDYIRVSNPSIWIVLAAVITLLTAVFVWGIFGSLPTKVTASGIAKDGMVTCYLSEEDVSKVSNGMPAEINNQKGTVASVGSKPMSYDEVSMKYPDAYTLYSLKPKEWNYPVVIKADGVADGIISLTITVNSIKPISFIFN